MRRRLLSIASAVVLLLAAAGAQAADPPAQTSAQTSVSGTVVSSTASSLVIRGSAGEDQTFVLDGNTMVPETLSPGMKVTVDFKPLADGRKQATRVTATKADTGTDPKTKAK